MTILIILIAIYILGRLCIKENFLYDKVNNIISLIKYDTIKYFVAGIIALIIITIFSVIITCIGLMFVFFTNLS